MLLFLDTTAMEFVSVTNLSTTVTTATARRNDSAKVRISLVEEGEIVTPPSSSVSVYVTASGDYESLLTSGESFTISGSGREGYFEGDLDFSTTPITSAFTDGTIDTVDAILEVRLTDSAGVRTSAPISLSIQNSYTAP